MRRVCYQVAASLDGHIATEDGGYDWLVMDPEIDFGEMFARFDTLLMGRKTWEVARGGPGMRGMAVYVVSTTLDPEEHPGVTVISDGVEAAVEELRRRDGKDIWLFGGGQLFRSLLDAGLVDAVEIAVMPVLLGGGIPMLRPPARQVSLELTGHRVYGTSGIVSMAYDVLR